MSQKVNDSFSELRRSYQTSGPPEESYTSLLSIALLFLAIRSLSKKRHGIVGSAPLSLSLKSPSSYNNLFQIHFKECYFQKNQNFSLLRQYFWNSLKSHVRNIIPRITFQGISIILSEKNRKHFSKIENSSNSFWSEYINFWRVFQIFFELRWNYQNS